MPRKPLRQCAINNCPNLVEKDGDIYCKEHKSLENKKYNKYLRGYVSSKRYDFKWSKLRNKYLSMHPLCEECLLEHKSTLATIVHHKIPVEVNPDLMYDINNLESVCVSCHNRIHSSAEDKKTE